MEIRTLKAEEIDCRVGTCNAKGFTLLLYKDARVDMNILDEVFKSNNWQRDHKEIKGNLYAGIGIWDEEKGEWVWKWDCGTESFTEKEKGEASDSFKRAGFNVGIGRELYTCPFIWITGRTEQKENGKYVPKIKYFEVKKIAYNKSREIEELEIIDKSTGDTLFKFKGYNNISQGINLDMALSEINEMLIELDVDTEQFFKHFKVENVVELTDKQKIEAIKLLRQKKSKKEN